MRQWIIALVQIMACGPFGAKPLSEPLLGYCQLDPNEQNSVIFFSSKYKTFHSRKNVCKYRMRKGGHLSRGRGVFPVGRHRYCADRTSRAERGEHEWSGLSLLHMTYVPLSANPHIKLIHWGRDKMAVNFLTTILNAFSWIKIYEFRLWFRRRLFPRV